MVKKSNSDFVASHHDKMAFICGVECYFVYQALNSFEITVWVNIMVHSETELLVINASGLERPCPIGAFYGQELRLW